MFVSTLQLDDIGVCSGLKSLISIESLLCVLVECLQIGDLGCTLQEVREVKIQLSNKHTELGAPVTHVVDTEHFVAEELEDTADRVSLDG